jgi:hypothetical protein
MHSTPEPISQYCDFFCSPYTSDRIVKILMERAVILGQIKLICSGPHAKYKLPTSIGNRVLFVYLRTSRTSEISVAVVMTNPTERAAKILFPRTVKPTVTNQAVKGVYTKSKSL